MPGGADENAGKRPRVDTYDSSPAAAAAAGGGGCSTGVAVDGGQPSDQQMRPVIDWADKANVCRLVPLLKKIKSLEVQTAAVLLKVRPNVTPTLADKVPGLSNKLQTLDQSVMWRHDMLRGLIKTLDSVGVAKPPLPRPIANKTLPPDAKISQLGRPCLDGLPPDVAHIVLAFLPTKDAAPLSRVNQAMKQVVTDDTRGVYRHLVIGVDDWQWWHRNTRRNARRRGEDLGVSDDDSNEEDGDDEEDEEEEGEDDSAGEGAAGGADLRRQREDETLHNLKQKLGRLRTVHIGTYWKGLSFPLKCIEASRDTITSMKLCETFSYHYSVPTSPPTVAFSQLEDLYVKSWPDHRGFRGWQFPSLLRLKMPNWLERNVKDILDHAPKLKSLSIGYLSVISLDDFASLIQGCPHLIDIKWVQMDRIEMDGSHEFALKLGKLKRALDPIWSKDSLKDVEKRIGLEFSGRIFVPFTHELLHSRDPDAMSLPAFLDWAASVKCTIDWKASRMDIDCSRDLVISPPAPTGPIAKMIKIMCSTAHDVFLWCGGKPLDQSWAGLLVFTKATCLMMVDLSSSRALSSVPQWMAAKSDTTGGNRHLPNITTLDLDTGDDGRGRRRLPDDATGLDGLGALLGTFDRLTKLSLGCLSNLGVAAFCLSQLPPTAKLKSVHVTASAWASGSSEAQAVPECTRYPHIASLTVKVHDGHTTDKVVSGVALAFAVRPATLSLGGYVEPGSPSVVEQCIDQAERDHYALLADDSEAIGDDEEGLNRRISLELVRLQSA
ncbi:unnamed protein product [Vitrella brassicaformis CCMP3155]|uniref:F-box domain-containing protein n=1 Tax=Vitrella brassicaformis (strain CCMP3155) TaxID=1169540 RepID=A0A0G4H4A4_VITBC|nr:unnamed protein product [Vitrella brassicaformis CCMP3155]|eukprot:CEM38451.1 unnamed protein product [Vitrella brassicaformis CCMP3155]